MSEARGVVILGSTGSIGTQAISVIDDHPGEFQVRAISAGGHDIAALAAQAAHLRVEAVGVADSGAVGQLRDELDRLYKREKLGVRPEILAGPDAASDIAAMGADTVLNAITGSVGLRPTLAAVNATVPDPCDHGHNCVAPTCGAGYHVPRANRTRNGSLQCSSATEKS